MRLDRPGFLPVAAALVAAALQVALVVPAGDWQDRATTVAVAAGILVAVLAGAVGGIWVGLAAAAAGWTLQLLVVADDAAEALVALPLWLAAGAAAGWLAARLERRTAERALAQGELEAAREYAAEAILGLDADGVIAAWSRGAEALYGYRAEEAQGRPLGELFADGAVAARVLDALARGEPVVREEARQRRGDGSEFRAAVSARAVDSRDGVPTGSVLVATDVDEEARLRDRLGDTEAQLRSLTEHLPLVTYVHPPGERLAPVRVSGQLDRLVGYTAEEWLADPGLFARLLHPDDRERVLAEVAALPDPTTPLRSEYRLVARDGRTVWVRDEAVVVLDGSGAPLCAQGFLLDVTERRTADEDRRQLRAAEAAATADARDRQRRLDAVGDAAATLASSLDYRLTIREMAALAVRDLCDWCIADVLEEDGELVRVAAERAEPAPALPVPAPVAEPEVAEVVRTQELELSESRICVPLLSRGRRSLGALTFLTAEHGRRFTADDLPWAQALAAVAAVAVENARLYEEAETRADAMRVLTYVGDGVFLLDRSGVVRLWNPAAEAITGLPAAAVLGRAAAEAIPGWPEVAERTPVAAAKEPARAEALPFETERGERWISISGVEFFGGTVYAFRDITDAHRLDELQADFIATASHELRTPLAAVYGAAQTLRRHDFALDEAGRERFISLIVDESDRLGRIVNQILLANQLDVGRLDLVTEPFDPVELVERVVEAARTHTPPHIAVEVDAPEPVPAVAADRDRVRQILVNLVDNAIKYSPDGGTIEVGVAAAGGGVLFRVCDEGLGIPADEQPRVFEKFYRLDPDMTRGIGGTGLGLYICSELVERMGGRIWVESRQPRGSSFFFELPSVDAPRAHAKREGAERAA